MIAKILKTLTYLSKLIIIIIASLVILFLLVWSGVAIYDHYQDSRLEGAVTSQLNSNNKIAKYSANQKTANDLQKEKIKSVNIDSDNQGSDNILYYVGEVNSQTYGMTFTDKNGTIKLKSIALYNTKAK